MHNSRRYIETTKFGVVITVNLKTVLLERGMAGIYSFGMEFLIEFEYFAGLLLVHEGEYFLSERTADRFGWLHGKDCRSVSVSGIYKGL